MPYFRRIAKKRGFKHHRKFSIFRINLKDLPRYAQDGRLAAADLYKSQQLPSTTKVKLLGEGNVDKAYQVQVHLVSGGAADKIKAAGGSVEIIK